MSSSTRAWLQMHFCVFLWGFTAILGKTITLPALPLVWWRMMLVAAALMLTTRFWRGLARQSPRMIATYTGIGALVGLHWLTFYGSIKLSNASVAAMCMALAPVFVAFTEPVLVGRRFDARELIFGAAVVPGIALVVGGVPVQMRTGIAVGIFSAFILSIFSPLNKRFVERGEPLSVTGLEMGAGMLSLTVLAPLLPISESAFVLPSRHDVILLGILAMGCTLLPFALSLVALRHLSAFTAQLAVNMEPVYAILLAIILLGEQHELSFRFYGGVAIVLLVVFSHPLLMRPKQPAAQVSPFI